MDPLMIALLTLLITVVVTSISWAIAWSGKEEKLINKKRENALLKENVQTNWNLFISELNAIPKNRISHIIWSNCINDKQADLSKISFRAEQLKLANQIENIDQLIDAGVLIINSSSVNTGLYAPNAQSVTLDGKPTDRYKQTEAFAVNSLCKMVNYMITGGWSASGITKNDVEVINGINKK